MRTLDQIDADITAIEQKKIRPTTDYLLDPLNNNGLGLFALNKIRELESQLSTVRQERRDVVAAMSTPAPTDTPTPTPTPTETPLP